MSSVFYKIISQLKLYKEKKISVSSDSQTK
jgi:hypothetical protein